MVHWRKNYLIDELELLAIKFCLGSFCKDLCNEVFYIMSDNTTTISSINHIGRTKSAWCNNIAKEIWNWVFGKGLVLIKFHKKKKADQRSHVFIDHGKWMLFDEIFKEIGDIWGTLDRDLFANRLNHTITEYASWKPYPESSFINAFSKKC